MDTITNPHRNFQYMTPEDIHFTKTISNWVLVVAVILIVHSLLYGIFFLLICISTVIFIRRGLKSRAQRMMFTISIVCFVLFSLYWAVNVMIMITFVKSILIDNIELPEVDNLRLYNIKTQSIITMGEVIVELPPIISDMVVVWRAWVIFPSRRKLMIGPVVLLNCTIVTTILYLLSFNNRVPALLNDAPVVKGLGTAIIAASLATNLTATLLISYNLWDHRKRVPVNLGPQGSLSQGAKILAVLVESGVIYCIIQVVTLVLQITCTVKHTGEIYAYEIIFVVYYGTSAMYPVVVIVLVHLQLSFEHTCGFSLVSEVQGRDHKNKSYPATIGQLKFSSASSDSTISRENGETLEESRTREGSNA